MNKLIQWVPEILQATDEDILRFGPQAARVRALLNFLPTMSDNAARVSNAAWDDATRKAAWINANDAAWNAARNDAWDAATHMARNAASKAGMVAAHDAARVGASDSAIYAAHKAAWEGARDAAWAEVVNDLIEPETYRILTNPLNAGRVYDLRAPEAGSEFMRLIRELRPRSVDDVERLADLSVDPRAQGIIELLSSLEGGMPLAAKIDAARRLDRASRAGRRGV
jgi:hypothetical protein